jgi:predicted nucleic acid-binding protein
MESVYIETSVVSYLVANPSRDRVTALRQQLTREWWAETRWQFACMISQEVLAEAMAGDSAMAAQRLAALHGLPLVTGGLESTKLAMDLVARGLFPANARTDAYHLAVATCVNADYLLTWNYRHLANENVLGHLEKFMSERALHLPRVCTPEDFMGK